MKKKVQAKTRQGYKGSGGNPKQERVLSKTKGLQPTNKDQKAYRNKREGHSTARK
jgi:hypothetical protein